MGGGEPGLQAVLEFLWGCAYGSAVIGVRDFPEDHVAIAELDFKRVPRGNVAIDLAVNQEDWDSGSGDGILGRDLLHVDVILPADVEEGEFDDGAEDGASEPGAQVEGLAHAVIGDFAKGGEGRFGDDGAEAGLDGKGLQKFGCAHRFSESEDAVRVNLRGEEVEPLVDIVAFEEAIGGELATACAVSAGIGEKHGESVGEEEVRVSGHADAVVGEAVQKNDGVTVAAPMGMNDPGAEGDGVWGGDGNVL